ncbi:MAG: PLP-dependent aminotransferase family protein [Caulobacteraceae bacterium]|nr:PLP-dependent aminotransferase family protein [Caulobacteraceae bacterium]
MNAATDRWLDRVERGGRPLYLALAEALESAIREGELQPGDQLPPQRAVAERLGVDFTTITRAYGAARARGLVEGAVGRGTFVRARAADDEAGLVDLSMNLPPPPQGVSLGALMKATARTILERTDPAILMAYHPGAGTLGQKTAGAAWLAPCLGEIAAERVLIGPGAQTALTAILAAVTRPGDAVIVEPLTYPGLRAAAEQRGLRLIPCPVDAEGVVPAALDRLCAAEGPAALYLVPTTQNPTASTMGLERRQTVARIAETRGVWLIEDDPYGRLFDAPPPALCRFAPTRGLYVATVSKCLSPGLRTAFVVTPGGEIGDAVARALRATALMASPLMTAMVGSWIREGQAEALLEGVRREARARRAIAAEILPLAQGAAEGVHVWLDLPPGLDPGRLRLMAQQQGVSVVTADAFAIGPVRREGGLREGVRISLGGPARQAVLSDALRRIAGVLDGARSRQGVGRGMVV